MERPSEGAEGVRGARCKEEPAISSELAYLNGKFLPLDRAFVSIEDRGFQFGDSVYEVIAVYDGRPFLAERHLERLRRSTAAIQLDLDLDALNLPEVIREGLERSGLGDALVYIQLTRGYAPRSHLVPARTTPTVVLTFKRLVTPSEETYARGVSVMTTREIRWAHCFIKAVTLLPNVLARTEAHRRGYDDAIFVTDAGEVREGTSSNVFVVQDGAVHLPPRTEAVLHGITQSVILGCAETVGVPVVERAFDVDFLHAADEVFLSSTTIEVLGVTAVDDQPVGAGKVGPITRKLHGELRRRTRCPAEPLGCAV